MAARARITSSRSLRAISVFRFRPFIYGHCIAVVYTCKKNLIIILQVAIHSVMNAFVYRGIMKTKRLKKQSNWRLSPASIALLKRVADESGLTQTQVVEACVAKHAQTVPGLADKARKALMEVVAQELGTNKGE